MRNRATTDPDDAARESLDAAEESPVDEPGTNAEAADDGGDLVTLPRAEYDDLQKKSQEHTVLLDQLRRAKAELENLQKRVRRERPGWEAQAVRPILRDILGVVDDFERAIDAAEGASADSLRQGIELIYRMVCQALEEHQVKEIAALGEPFDPEYHEAVRQIMTEKAEEDGSVLDVHQKGYLHRGAVLRPAKVGVGKAIVVDGGQPDAESGESPA